MKLLSDYVKGLVQGDGRGNKFLGYCPLCGRIVAGKDIISLHAKELSKLRIECPKCEKKMQAKKLTKRNPLVKVKRVRTKFPVPETSHMIEQFIDLYNLEMLFGDRLTVKYRESLASQGVSKHEMDYVENIASRRTKYNDNRFIAQKVKTLTGKNALPMLVSLRR